MMITFGAAKLQRLMYVELPYALPSFLSGVKVSVTSAMIGAIVLTLRDRESVTGHDDNFARVTE